MIPVELNEQIETAIGVALNVGVCQFQISVGESKQSAKRLRFVIFQDLELGPAKKIDQSAELPKIIEAAERKADPEIEGAPV